MTLHSAAGWTIEQGAPVGPQLYRILRERIIRNDLKPGSRISESELASVYSVSRQPVREAFIKLAEEALVDVRPQRGTYVRKISTAAVMDARFVREAIEADIVKLLAGARSDALVDDLRAQIAEQREVAGTDPVRFMELDERFHRTLAEAAGKAAAWSVVESLKAQMDRVRYLSLPQATPIRRLIDQHTRIVDAVEARDAATAEAAMRVHLGEILKSLPDLERKFPDLFAHDA